MNPWHRLPPLRSLRVLEAAVRHENYTRAADELDFRVAREILEDEPRDWLIDALRLTAPSHPWLKSLEG